MGILSNFRIGVIALNYHWAVECSQKKSNVIKQNYHPNEMQKGIYINLPFYIQYLHTYTVCVCVGVCTYMSTQLAERILTSKISTWVWSSVIQTNILLQSKRWNTYQSPLQLWSGRWWASQKTLPSHPRTAAEQLLQQSCYLSARFLFYSQEQKMIGKRKTAWAKNFNPIGTG